jgi:hypothetical protein
MSDLSSRSGSIRAAEITAAMCRYFGNYAFIFGPIKLLFRYGGVIQRNRHRSPLLLTYTHDS